MTKVLSKWYIHISLLLVATITFCVSVNMKTAPKEDERGSFFVKTAVPEYPFPDPADPWAAQYRRSDWCGLRPGPSGNREASGGCPLPSGNGRSAARYGSKATVYKRPHTWQT